MFNFFCYIKITPEIKNQLFPKSIRSKMDEKIDYLKLKQIYFLKITLKRNKQKRVFIHQVLHQVPVAAWLWPRAPLNEVIPNILSDISSIQGWKWTA